MSGFYGSKDFGALLVDGYDMLAAKLASFAWKITVGLERVDGIGSSWEEYAPTGMRTATISQMGGFFNTTTNKMHTAFAAMASTVRTVCFAPAGNTIGDIFVGCEGAYNESYDAAPPVGKLVKANAVARVSGQIDEGVIVQHKTAKTADWNTKTLSTVVDFASDTTQIPIPISSASKAAACIVTTSVPHGLSTGHRILTTSNTLSGPSINSEQDVTVLTTTTFSIAVNTAASSGAGTGGSFVRCNSLDGGVGYQALSAVSGFTNFVGKIRHSEDDSTYSDLITFADSVAVGAERETVTGEVYRYLCFDGNVTGSGSVTPFVGFKRN